MDILQLIDRLEELFNESKNIPLTRNVMVDEDRMLDIIDQMRIAIPEEVKKAVTRFGQAEDVMTRKHEGIGLGLPLAKSLTELLGGKLTIASERGMGTTITLAFSEDSVRERPFEWQKPPDRMAERAKKFAEKQSQGAE